MNSAERAATWENVFHDIAMAAELVGVTDDADAGTNRACQIHCAGEQGFVAEAKECFVGAHAGTLAASQDESGHCLIDWPIHGFGPALPSTTVTYQNPCCHRMMGFLVFSNERTNMPQRLLDSLRLRVCGHEFSWPRRAADGQYYQVCLLCAEEYQYDWNTMKRVKRVEHVSPAESAAQRRRSHARKPTWVPRARRLKLNNPLRYRVKNLGTWYEGTIENLSQSGILFHGAQRFPINTLVEMVFEMPEEISGQKNSNVLCDARITRANQMAEDPQEEVCAAVILGYKFIHSN